MKRIFTLLILASFFAGCTSTISLPVLKPADVTLPSEIQKFTVVNRSRPDKQHMVWSVIQGALNGQGLFEDREAAEQCIGGLVQTLQQTPRFTINQATLEYKGTGTDIFAPPLSWEEVQGLCTQYNSEA
ncbi:MAG TPA: DUF6340 family protein, partial [Bacteroidia bacterium]